MSQKSSSRESIIKRSINCTCSGIAYVVSHSSNEEFRKSVMTGLEVKDTVEMKSKLHCKLMDISKLRHGGHSSWQIDDSNIRKTKSFETISTADNCAETSRTVGSFGEKSDDDWSKIGMLLHSDEIIEPVAKKTCQPAVTLGNTKSDHPNVTQIPRKSVEGDQHETTSVERFLIDDERIASSTLVIMKTPDLSQIIEGVKNVSPFCQLAVESPSINDSSRAVSTCFIEYGTNHSIAMQDFLTTNMPRKESETNSYLIQSVLKEHAGLDNTHVPYTDHTESYNKNTQGTCTNNGGIHLGAGRPVYKITEIDTIQTPARTTASQMYTSIHNELQTETLTRKDRSGVADVLYNLQSLHNKRLKADGDIITGTDVANEITVRQPDASGDHVHIEHPDTTSDRVHIEQPGTTSDRVQEVDTDEWFDNVLLEIEDWLN